MPEPSPVLIESLQPEGQPCAWGKCGKTFVPRHSGRKQKYCTKRCRYRDIQNRWRQDHVHEARARDRKRHLLHPERAWAQGLRRNYGLAREQWDVLLISQSGRCAVCCSPMPEPHVDHDHKTGVVRGLLDSRCNTGIGLLDENPNVLRAAIEYLERN